MTPQDIAAVAGKLTKAQREALTPLTFFSDADGRVLERLGLMISDRGAAWRHTPLGEQVRAHLLKGQSNVG